QRDDERLADALERLPPGRHAFEFRHESWFADDVYELLRERDVALVVAHTPSRPFQTFELTAHWTYVRLHGGRGPGGDYSPQELGAWRRRIERVGETRDAHVYFNNDWALALSAENFARYV